MRHFGWLSIVAVGFSASAFSAQCISYSHGSLYLLIHAHTHTHSRASLDVSQSTQYPLSFPNNATVVTFDPGGSELTSSVVCVFTLM